MLADIQSKKVLQHKTVLLHIRSIDVLFLNLILKNFEYKLY